MHHLARVAVLAVIFASSLAPCGVARAWARAVSESGAPLFWSSRRIAIRPSSDPSGAIADLELARIIGDASMGWSSVGPCTDLSVVFDGMGDASTTNLDGGAYDGENRVVIRRVNWPAALGSATLAITTTAYITRTGELLDADVDVNGIDARLSVAARPLPDEDDLANTVTHELGHALGLAHSRVPSATMFTTSERGEILKRDLDADDRDAICTLYPTGRPTPDGPLERTAGCGCALGTDRTMPLWRAVLLVIALALRRVRSR